MGQTVAPRIALAGFGSVGRRFVRLALEKGFVVTGLADSSASLISRDGLPRECVEEALGSPRPRGLSRVTCSGVGRGAPEDVADTAYDVFVLATASSHSDAVPGLGYARRVLGSGGRLVTADKPPLAHGLLDLLATASERGGRLYYKATVMAGTPLIDVLRYGLAGARIGLVRGALNTTTNYIASLVEEGLRGEEALERAVREGIAEPDPRADLEGLDLAAKAAIIAQTLGCPTKMRDVVVEDALGLEDLGRLRGKRMVATVDAVKCEARVALVEARGPLAMARGRSNVAEVVVAGDHILLVGPGAGVDATARTLLSDALLALSDGFIGLLPRAGSQPASEHSGYP